MITKIIILILLAWIVYYIMMKVQDEANDRKFAELIKNEIQGGNKNGS